MNNILEIKGLTKHYGNITAVNNLNVTIPRGSVFGVLGPNGSGKTTTLACVLGIVLPDSGTFKWFDLPAGQLANNKLGAIIEQPNFYPYLNAIQNLELVAKIRNIKNPMPEIERVLHKVHLFERSTSSFSSYSYGMKRRLALAATLLGDPDLLIFDEPTNGLDPEGISFVRNLIIDQAKLGKTIIIASHILDEVEKVCTDVMILKNGNLITSGKVVDVLQGDEKIHLISDDNNALHELLVRNDIVQSAEFENDKLIIVLKKGVKTRQISELAFENKIIITNIETKKKTLEDEFLELIK
ncbi:MAG: ABC transporter ATP-binding protein [Bacteroidales bacterium]|nr:ABC transporter ATP-binding protein [Bacteroidales bacterium]